LFKTLPFFCDLSRGTGTKDKQRIFLALLVSKRRQRVHANFVGTLEEEREDIPDKKRKSPQTRKEGAKR